MVNMKKFILIICTLLFIIPLYARDLGNASSSEYRYKVVSKKVLNVRNSPSTNSRVLFTVNPGDYIYGNAVNDEWVTVPGNEWYLSSAWLQKEENPLYMNTEAAEESDYSDADIFKIQRIVRWCLLGVCIIFFIFFLIASWDGIYTMFKISTNGKSFKAEDGNFYYMQRKFYYGITSYLGVLSVAGLIVAAIIAGVLTVMLVGGAVWLILAIVWVLMYILIIVGWLSIIAGVLCFFFGDKEQGCLWGLLAIIGGVIVAFTDAITDFGEAVLDAGFSFFRHLYILDFARDLVVLYWQPALMVMAIPLVIFFAFVLITLLVSGILMLTEYIVMRRYNIKNPCPVCQHASEPAIYLEQGYELPVPLHPGKYGLFKIKHPVTGKKMPTMLFNGKDALVRKCKHCGNRISADMGTEKHIALAGVAESGKTTLVYRIIAELMSKYPNAVSFTDVLQSDYRMMEDIKYIAQEGYIENFPEKTTVGQRRAIQLRIDRGLNMFYRLFINDVGGELYAMNSMNSTDSALTAQFVRNVESIVFLVDPMTIDFSDCDVSDEFKIWLNTHKSDNQKINIFDAFSRLCEFFSSQHMSKGEISRINFNIVLVKSDMGYLSKIDTSMPEAIQGFMRSDMGLDRLIADIYNTFKENNIHYVAFSATEKSEQKSNAGMLADMLLKQLNIEVAKNASSRKRERDYNNVQEVAFTEPVANNTSVEPEDFEEVHPIVAESEESVALESTEPLYDVVLAECGAARLQILKVVKELTGTSLLDAKNMVDNAPSTILSAVSEERAKEAATYIDDAGGTVEIRKHQ